MGKIGKKLFTELVMEKINQKKISHTRLAEKLGITKYALSKVINGKQKMYLHEFLELSYAINLLHPNLSKPLEYEIMARMDYDEFEETVRRKISGEYTLDKHREECEKVQTEYEMKKKEVEEKLSELKAIEKLLHKKVDWQELEKMIAAINKYARDVKGNDVPIKVYFMLATILENFEKCDTSFDAETYIDYMNYKNNHYLEHHQLVLNFDELKE